MKRLQRIAGSAHARADSFLPVAPSGAGPLTEFAQRGDLMDEVLLPSDSGLGRTEAVFAAKKGELAIAGGVKPGGALTALFKSTTAKSP